MKLRARKIVFWCILMLTVYLIVDIFLPIRYPVSEYNIRPGTQFWNIPGGSHIGYFHIPGRGIRKPYPVIYLHGGPGGPVYDRNIELHKPLANAGYDVYLYDQIGCGASSRLGNISEYTVKRHLSDLRFIVDKLGSEKVILIGQSWGSMLAAAFIAENPTRMERVIFTGPGPILPWKENSENIKAPDSLHLRMPVFTNRDGRKKIYNLRARITELLAKAFDYKLASDREMDKFMTLLNREMAKSTVCNPANAVLHNQNDGGSGYYVMVKTVQSFDNAGNIRDQLVDCPVPALIIRGQCDGKPWGYTAEYLQLFKNSNLVMIPDAGHSVGSEQPEAYINAVSDFLEAHQSQPSF